MSLAGGLDMDLLIKEFLALKAAYDDLLRRVIELEDDIVILNNVVFIPDEME